MIERLQRALEHIEELSPEAQQDLAQLIEDLTTPPQAETAGPLAGENLSLGVQVALRLGGAWSDLLDDDEFVALDRLRHASAPTPSVEEQLAWLDEPHD